MKKNLLKVFLLSAATVGMVFSSCTNYDDDIDDLNQRIEELSGEIALKTDKSAVSALEQKLSGIDFSKYATTESVEAAIKAAEKQVKADLEAAIKGIKTLSEDDVKGIFTEQMKAYDVWGSVNTKVADAIQEALKGTLKQGDINDIIAAAVAEINKDGSDIRKAILSIVGKDMASTLQNYVTKDVLNGYVEAADAKYTAMEKDVEAKFSAANEALVEEVKGLISANNTVQRADLDTAFAKYDKKIASLWTAVSNLANRIQSLVYVPTSMDGVATFSNYNIAGTPLTTGAGTKTAMAFRVSPASLAEALASGYNAGKVRMEFLPEEVTRATEAAFTIEGDVTAKDGKVEMLVSTDYTYASTTETYAIALRVIDSKKQEGETVETGSEFTTEYIPTTGGASVNVYNDIVLADKDGKKVNPTAIIDTIQYHVTDAEHTFLEGYKFAYEVAADNVISLAEAAAKYNWDVTPEETPVIKRTGFTATGVANLDITPEDPMANDAAKAKLVTVSLEEAVAANIGKSVTDEGELGIKVGDAAPIFSSGTSTKEYSAELRITKRKLAAIKLDKVSFVWNYDNYNSGAAYVKDNFLISNSGLTYGQFNDLLFSDPTVSWEITGSNITNVNPAIGISIEGVSTPSADNDVQLVKISVDNYKKNKSQRHESITFKGVVPVSSVAEVEFSGEIEFKGLPTVKFPISVPQGQYTVDGANLVVEIAENFADSLYKVNEGVLKEHFSNTANFVSFMGSDVSANFPVEQKKVGAAMQTYAGLERSGSALNAYFVSDFINFNEADSYTFNVQGSTWVKKTDAGFQVKFTKGDKVTINKNNNFFLKRGENLFTSAETPYLVTSGILSETGDSYTVSNVDLTKAYSASMTGADVAYVLAAAPAGYTGAYPTLSGSTLNWNGCSLNSVKVTATLTVAGITVDVKEFNVVLENPIVGPAVQQTESESGEALNVLEVSEGNSASIKLLKGVTLKDFKGNFVINPDPAIGLVASASSADVYDAAVAYGTPVYKVKDANGEFVVDNTISFSRLSVSGGELVVSADDARLAHEIEVTVPVELTHKYSVEETNATTHTWARKAIKFNVVFIVKNVE